MPLQPENMRLDQPENWPALEDSFASAPNQIESLVDEWVRQRLAAISAQPYMFGEVRRELRADASYRVWVLAMQAREFGYWRVASALEQARHRVW